MCVLLFVFLFLHGLLATQLGREQSTREWLCTTSFGQTDGYPWNTALVTASISFSMSLSLSAWFSPLSLSVFLCLSVFPRPSHFSRSVRRLRVYASKTGQHLADHRLVGLVVKASTSRVEEPGFESHLRRDFFGVESYQWLKNWHCSGYPPGVIGSVLAPVGPVSVYFDWVKWKVWSATSSSVWQHVQLSEQIRPWDTLACAGTLSNQQTTT